jgi:type IV secretion system protein VirD4
MKRLRDPAPDALSPGSLLLGWRAPPAAAPIGFAPPRSAPHHGESPLTYDGDGHLITLAPTRSGKGRGALIPNLLLYSGPVIVFDPKGELYRVTARCRREMGQRVIKLDPCQVAGADGDTLNPFDIFTLDNADLETDAQTLAEWLSQGNRGTKEPFWDVQASALHSALIAHVASALPAEERNLESIRKLLIADDTVYNLAVVLDTQGKAMNRMAHDEIAAFLQTTDVTRSGILSTAQAYIKPFLSPRMGAALCNSTFDLQDVVRAAPLTIYMVLPPDKLKSHRALLKMWVGTFLKALTSRKHIPPLRTLMLLDECAQLEHFPYLETLMTLCAGYGVQCWTFWQDMAQLHGCYPASWQTILNNCAVLQTFGIRNRHMASQWGNYLEHGPQALLALPPQNQIVHMHGVGEFCCRRPDYLGDPVVAGLFDDNPFYEHPGPDEHAVQRPSTPDQSTSTRYLNGGV